MRAQSLDGPGVITGGSSFDEEEANDFAPSEGDSDNSASA